ncbi:hypothetical protein M441DRAFT_412556 [Trichoderma asperellum CBS 433.97]|uniref:Uncharacterized protein n=1 Tax=Trichoderma asperellum (strain ATCC 204424 / CBS 433.97 / NBRC 101777) TaxID=1042311 RepID=A0A2T3Z7P7_TRIA4|nr:hypothetical protein M441DRAFT_412556 [Trichoderma asperellum CBS 433.97]PTB40800.1 hypothetical protein M441DRAFT_412556 [Trichoderma asperellum CBS 433.97]
MSSHKTRPARSNSLQRMLELERRYMLERLEASRNSISKPDTVSRPPPAPSSRPAAQAYRIESSTQKDARKGASTTRDKMPITQIVPLTINISSTNLGLDATTETGTDAQIKTVILPQSQPGSKPVLKAVSFDVPPSGDEDERRSICQSPSWEAYGRRKKTEKKDVKKEQKKEQLKREQQKKEEERKEQERKEQLRKEQLRKEQLKKEQLKKEQLKKEQLEKEQRKKEQQVKATKREKEESTLRNALIKKKRLSKQPPASSPHAIDQANRMTSAAALAASRDRQRPSSALEFTTPSGDDVPSRPHHGRSGSFTSLIRSPFESRRASLETSRPSETGFIGGIKLEIQRHAAYQKTVEGPEKMDESKIHPALRTNNAHNQKWSAPPARPNPESQRRAYPPITRHPATAAKTRSLISSAEMDASDAGTMDRWRAFVGLKPKDSGESSKAATQQQASKQPVTTNEAANPASAVSPPQTNVKEKPAVVAASQTSRGPDISQPNLPNGSGKPLDQSSKPKLTVSTAILPSNSPVPAPRPQPREKTAQPSLVSSPDGMKSGEIADKGLTQNVASSQLSLPPAPPRRSSKRNSLLSLNSVSSVSSPRSPAHRPSSSDSSNSNHDLAAVKSNGVSESHTTVTTPHGRAHNSPNLVTSAIEPKGVELQGGGASLRTSTPREASRIARDHRPDPINIPLWDDIESSVLQAIDTKISLSPIRKSHNSLRDDSDFTVRRLTDGPAPTTSGDDSSSDDFHSISMPGTPDTSRAQSEKDIPPMKDAESKRLATESRMRTSSQSPARQPLLLQPGAGSSQNSLGLKNSRPVGKTTTAVVPGQAIYHRLQLEADVIPGADFLPKLKHQPLKVVEHVAMPKQHLQSTLLVPGPALYLEEARKATPLAPPPPLLGSPRLGPKVTPPSSIRSQPSSTSDLALAKAPRHVPGSPVVGGEPIAKMFVECCGCKYFHDMPSNLYEAMANPEAIIRPRGNVGFAGAVSMTVKCPWCSHEMSTKCCAGYAAMVYVKERLH